MDKEVKEVFLVRLSRMKFMSWFLDIGHFIALFLSLLAYHLLNSFDNEVLKQIGFLFLLSTFVQALIFGRLKFLVTLNDLVESTEYKQNEFLSFNPFKVYNNTLYFLKKYLLNFNKGYAREFLAICVFLYIPAIYTSISLISVPTYHELLKHIL
ncbi:hypothetical protein JK211_14525 [Tatumella sp. JGM130]|uniref:hypothetical protein n=1 Tax=Tatumella sp. JGM130 TaxID=2799797 RepID=UPI001BB0C87A|nr:hypothetical protein [Tatumella sp. JGM130]MBS0895230.1 hypothetical protein [Tatumella sp. JGM130]